MPKLQRKQYNVAALDGRYAVPDGTPPIPTDTILQSTQSYANYQIIIG